MAKVTIDGTEYEIPVLNIKSIKKVWPIVQKAQEARDPIEAIDYAIQIIALGMMVSENPKASDEEIAAKTEWVEENMKGTETSGLRTAMREMLTESGLLNPDAKSGEALGDAPMVPSSTETLTA